MFSLTTLNIYPKQAYTQSVINFLSKNESFETAQNCYDFYLGTLRLSSKSSILKYQAR